jgi:hypothetical protein
MVNFRGKIMIISEYDDTDIADDSYLDTGISGFEIAYGTGNKTAIKRKAKRKLQVKRKLDLLQENRRLAKEIDTLYDEWEH